MSVAVPEIVPTVTRLPEVPLGNPVVVSSIVVFVLPVNFSVCGGVLTESDLNVPVPGALCEISSSPLAVALVKVSAGKVNPPVLIVRTLVVSPPTSIVQGAVERSIVKFVAVLKLIVAVALVELAIILPPLVLDFIPRVLVLVEESSPVVSVLPFKSRVPAVRVSVRVLPIVRLSASCTVAPGALMVIGKSSVPAALVVRTWVPDVAANIIVSASAG